MADAKIDDLITLTADIVSAHVSNNAVHTSEIPKFISAVHAALEQLGKAPARLTAEKPKGAVSARASIKPGHLVSMIDGKPYKMLRRHLSGHGYTPETYRETFGLPRDYPMVAPSYAEQRRTIARNAGLGRKPAAEASQRPARRKPSAFGNARSESEADLDRREPAETETN